MKSWWRDEAWLRLGQDVGLLILRVGLGLMMALGHGWPKLGRLSADPVKFADPLGLGATASLVLAIGAELGCSLLLIVGLGTRLAAVPLLCTMLVAALIVHGGDPWKKQEFALLYALPYLALICTGPGRLAVDHWIRQWMARREDREE